MSRGWLLGLAVLVPTTASADDTPRPIPIALHALPKTVRPLQYRLLPELFEQTDDDGAAAYAEATRLLNRVGDRQTALQIVSTWNAAKLEELPKASMAKLLARFADPIRQTEKAARCAQARWTHVERLRKEGISALISETQELRDLASLLSAKARWELLEGRWRDSLRTVKHGLAMSRHAAESPTLISSLVGIALAQIMLNRLEEIAAHPGVAGLYWPLTDLPSPLIDMRTAWQGERLMAYATFPGLAAIRGDLAAGPMTPEQVVKLTQMVVPQPKDVEAALERYARAFRVYQRHAKAKAALIAEGRPAELVEAMPHLQVALLHSAQQYDRLFEETLKWRNLPYWEAKPRLDEAEKRERRELESADGPALPIAREFLPAVQKLVNAGVRADRRVAALRCVEAVRLHAAEMKELPARLADVTAVPVPCDPVTGKPFAYECRDGKAFLTVSPAPGEPHSAATSFRFEITLVR